MNMAVFWTVTTCSLVLPGISEESAAFTTTAMIALMMAAACTSRTSINLHEATHKYDGLTSSVKEDCKHNFTF